ncbi:hypothetical protein AB7M38_002365 [Bradyrhizobium diazoefficiens]
MRVVRTICWTCGLIGLLCTSVPSQAQTNDNAPQAPSGAPASVPEQAALKPAELDALVAPIALYPDTLLSNVLMASTYPLEVVHADRWMNQNKGLMGDALKAATEKQDWDGSVKALVATPSVLQMMNEHLEWTQKLGEAFLAQQQEVMDAVQRLRSKAYDRQKLVTTREQNVTVKEDQNRRFIYIEPAVTDSIYVPYYEPQVVFGDWSYSDYPAYPYYWGLPRLYRRRHHRDWDRVRRSLRTGAVGNRRLLGRRRMVGRQPGQLGRRSYRHQPRCSRRALAARRKAPTRRTLQQSEPATKVWQREPTRRRGHRGGRSRRGRRAAVRDRRQPG